MTRTVFLLPGVYGDEAELARFRQMCEPELHLVLVELPDVDESAKMLRDMVQTGIHVARVIAALQPTGPLLIAGYSFGGSVAIEAARYLAERGREIRLVAVFDAFIPEPTTVARISLGSSGFRRLIWRGLIPLVDWDVGRRMLLKVIGSLWPPRRRIVRRRLLWGLRRRAMDLWRPRPLPSPVLLVMSREFEPVMRPRWLDMLPDAETMTLHCLHRDVLSPGSALLLRSALEHAIQRRP